MPSPATVEMVYCSQNSGAQANRRTAREQIAIRVLHTGLSPDQLDSVTSRGVHVGCRGKRREISGFLPKTVSLCHRRERPSRRSLSLFLSQVLEILFVFIAHEFDQVG